MADDSRRRGLSDSKQNVLALNVLLLGDRQSGRSSVGNALIGQWFSRFQLFYFCSLYIVLTLVLCEKQGEHM